MNKRILIIAAVYALTIIVNVIYSIYLLNTVDPSITIGVFFEFLLVTGAALFVETLIFAVIFYKHLKSVWVILLPVFLLAGFLAVAMFLL